MWMRPHKVILNLICFWSWTSLKIDQTTRFLFIIIFFYLVIESHDHSCKYIPYNCEQMLLN